MNRIRVLNSEVYNRIAAGEVVSQPASVVKELVENSLDAGADRITVEIEDGGMALIRVSDNGCGIAPEDVKNAFLPHATSKISRLDDLSSIATLGFRGEALPSIASVADVTMLSRAKDCALGTVYRIDNGAEIDFGDMGAQPGSEVTVRGLFERIPARRKFIKSTRAEESAVTNLLSRYILANPSVSFMYRANDKEMLHSSGGGLKSALKEVYSADFLENCVKIDSTMSDIGLFGYAGKPSFSKHSKAFQTLVVNGRYVWSDDISYTVYGCYAEFLMKRQYPVYVLHLRVPYDLVDINVHPNKMEIKFACLPLLKKLIKEALDNQIFREVRIPKAVRLSGGFDFASGGEPDQRPGAGLEETAAATDWVVFEKQAAFTDAAVKGASAKRADDPTSAILNVPDTRKSFQATGVTLRERPERARDYLEGVSGGFNAADWKIGKIDPFAGIVGRARASDEKGAATLGDAAVPQKNRTSTAKGETAAAFEQAGFFDGYPAVIAGRLFGTYILVQKGNDVYCIDQHAAHEKLNYDRMVASIEAGPGLRQPLLLPYDFTLSAEEAVLLEESLSVFDEIGFSIEPTAPQAFSLKAVPVGMAGLRLSEFIPAFMQAAKAGGDAGHALKNDKGLRAHIMQAACKASVRGEEDLSVSEIEALIGDMVRSNMALFCPHGRPVAVGFTRQDIEIWFKRIV